MRQIDAFCAAEARRDRRQRAKQIRTLRAAFWARDVGELLRQLDQEDSNGA